MQIAKPDRTDRHRAADEARESGARQQPPVAGRARRAGHRARRTRIPLAADPEPQIDFDRIAAPSGPPEFSQPATPAGASQPEPVKNWNGDGTPDLAQRLSAAAHGARAC